LMSIVVRIYHHLHAYIMWCFYACQRDPSAGCARPGSLIAEPSFPERGLIASGIKPEIQEKGASMTMKRMHFVSTAFLAALLALPAVAAAHLCDNVYRQADKVIFKPEFTNLIVKDRAEFRIFIQNNMDRGVETAGLEAESDAFDVTITPNAMEIPKARNERDRVSFKVVIVLKQGISSGSYRINFRLVGRGETGKGREIARYTVETGKEGVAIPASPALTVKGGSVPAPKIDGVLDDATWREAANFTGFKVSSGGQAANQTVGLVAFDRKNLYLAVVLTDSEIEKVRAAADDKEVQQSDVDRVAITIIPGGKTQYGFVVNARGAAEACKLVPGSKKPQQCGKGYAAAVGFDAAQKNWTVEAVIPLSVLGKQGIRNGEAWKFNVMRYRITDPRGEYRSCWSGLPSKHDDPAGMGKLKFEIAWGK